MDAPVLDTPGPTAYDIKTGLLNDAKHKHFGFIEKAKRFRELDIDERALHALDENNNVQNIQNTKPLHALPEQKNKIEEKLKKDVDRWKDKYTRITKEHEKEINTLKDQIMRIETLFQKSIREKNALQSHLAAKEKEYVEVLHRESNLKASLEKSEKTVASIQDKVSKSNATQRKLEDMEKKAMHDKRFAKENESLLDKIRELNERIKMMESNQENSNLLISQLNVDKKELKERVADLSSEAQKRLDEGKSLESCLRKDITELEYENKALVESTAILQQELNNVLESSESQKIAYLGRINELESNLEISNSSFKQKKNEADHLNSSLEQLTRQFELSKADLSQLESVYHRDLKEKESQILVLKDQLTCTQSKQLNASKMLEDSQKKIQELQFENSTLNRDKKDFQNQIDELKDSLGKEKEHLHSKSEEAHLFKSQLTEALETACSDVKRLKVTLEQNEFEFEKQLESQSTTLVNLKREFILKQESLESIIQSLQEQLSDSNKLYETEQQKVYTLESDISCLQNQSKEESNRHSILVADLQKALDIQKSLSMSKGFEWEERLNEIEKERDTVSAQVLVLEDQYEGLNQEMRQMSNDYEVKLSILLSESESKAIELSESQKMVNKLEDKLSEASRIQESNLAELVKDLETANLYSMELKQELEQANSQLQSKESELEEALNLFQNLKVEFSNSEQSLNQKLQGVTEALQNANENIILMEKQVSDLQMLLTESMAKRQEYESMINQLQDEKQKVYMQVEDVKTSSQERLDQQSLEMEGLEMKKSELQTSLLESQHDLNQCQVALEESRLENQHLQATMSEQLSLREDEIKNLVCSHEIAMSDSQNEISQLQNQQELRLKELQDLNSQLVESRDELTIKIQDNTVTFESKLNELESLLSLKMSELASINQQMIELENQLSQVTESESKLKEYTLQMESELAKQEAHIKDREKKLKDIQISCAVIQNQWEVCKKELMEQKQSIESLTMDLDSTRAQLKDMQEKHAFLESNSKADLNCQKDLVASLKVRVEELSMAKQVLESEFEKSQVEIQKYIQECQLERENTIKAQSHSDELESSLGTLKEESHDLFNKLQQSNDQLSKIDQAYQCELNELENTKSELMTELNLKTELLEDFECRMNDLQSRLSITELKLVNEVSSKDLQVKMYEDRYRKKCEECDQLSRASLEHKRSIVKIKDENQALVNELEKTRKGLKNVQDTEKSVCQEKRYLDSRLHELENENMKLSELSEQLQETVSELTRLNSDMAAEYEHHLQLLNQRGQLSKEEVKKLGDLNAELFGHSNNRQKIRYVAQIKEENLGLKKDNQLLSKQREELQKKVSNLQEQVDSFKSVGGGGLVRKMTRVAREVLKDQNI